MPHESLTNLAQRAEKPTKPSPSQKELRASMQKKFKAMEAPLTEGTNEYKKALSEGVFEDQEGEPDGAGEARKEAMQKQLTTMAERAKRIKALLASNEPLPSYTPDLHANYAYTNPETNQVEYRESITLDIEQKFNEFLSFYQKTNVDLPPDFEDTIRDIWERNQDAIQQAVEQEGFNEMLIIPGNLPLPALTDAMRMENGYYEGDNFKQGGSFAKAQSPHADKPRILLIHNAQNLNDRPELKKTLNIQGKDVNPDHALTLEEYLVFQRKYFEENKKHLDEIGWTWLATKSGARLVDSGWYPAHHRLYVNAVDRVSRDGTLGVRPSRCFF